MSEEKIRCAWCEKDEMYRNYHDNEWGNPVYDDDKLFEFLVLETFQAGLSWYTILKKRENFRIAFDAFNLSDLTNIITLDANLDRNKASYMALSPPPTTNVFF